MDEAKAIILYNEAERIKAKQKEEMEKEEAVRLMEEHGRMLDAQEKKKAQEWADREAKIKSFVDRMGAVVQKSDAEEKLRDK